MYTVTINTRAGIVYMNTLKLDISSNIIRMFDEATGRYLDFIINKGKDCGSCVFYRPSHLCNYYHLCVAICRLCHIDLSFTPVDNILEDL